MTASDSTDQPLPFQGLKVIDCASFIAAPVAATLLADLGADVVKIEPPEGDHVRIIGTPAHTPGMGPVFLRLMGSSCRQTGPSI